MADVRAILGMDVDPEGNVAPNAKKVCGLTWEKPTPWGVKGEGDTWEEAVVAAASAMKDYLLSE